MNFREDAVTFLTRHIDAHRVECAAACGGGRPGAGNVETTCRRLVGVGFMRFGPRWKQRLASHVLRLRTLALGHRWNAAMSLLPTNAIPRVEPIASPRSATPGIRCEAGGPCTTLASGDSSGEVGSRAECQRGVLDSDASEQQASSQGKDMCNGVRVD